MSTPEPHPPVEPAYIAAQRRAAALMADHEHRPGVIPRGQRRLALIVLICVGLAVAVGSLLINFLVGSPVNWFWIPAGSLVVTLLIGIFLWMRLSD